MSLLLAGILLLVSGCGPGKTSVTGSVQLDGKPAPPGSIVFVPAEEGNKVNASISDGKYAITPEQGILPGKYRVEISCPRKTGRKIPNPDPEYVREETVEQIPPKYNQSTELTVEITGGANTKDFDLTSR